MLYDAFICHASEDKAALVRPLAERLRAEHVEVWYDEFSLSVGDSLRRSIDRGLSQSRFGIVVLSPSFFAKRWSGWELDGLVARQNDGRQEVILPVWHDVGHSDVLAYSPSLADKLAATSASGLEEVVRKLVAVIRPQGSTLVIARDHLLDNGFSPPVVTDDWWLDVAAASESNDMEGDWQEPMGWGRWGFPLPARSEIPAERGWRLACAAMQMAWQEEAARRPITQIARPERVHEFIESQPHLQEVCSDYLRYLIAYAPQLVIPGFGGQYEDEIDTRYRASVAEGTRRRAANDPGGTGLTVDHRPPGCEEEFALRDPVFGGYEAPLIACGFVQGYAVANGPPVRYYENIDYVAWLLSDESQWLPAAVREVLTRGIAGWGVWGWHRGEHRRIVSLGFQEEPFSGAFSAALERTRTRETFRPGRDARRDAEHRLSFSAHWLGLPEDGATLAARLINEDFLGHYFAGRIDRRSRRAGV